MTKEYLLLNNPEVSNPLTNGTSCRSGLEQIQKALLGLLTTNFVSMTYSSAEIFDTRYRLSEFARMYLEKHHPVPEPARARIKMRGEQLSDWGSILTAERAQSPYAPHVISVRDRGDVHVARLLRDAVRLADSDPQQALELCREAQAFSPGYYEPWRIEGLLHSGVPDIAAATDAYLHALELAPDSGYRAYHIGDFYLNYAGDPQRGLSFLQKAIVSEVRSHEVLGQIAWAHYQLWDF